jgi:flagellar basal body rod protein FlgC
MIDGIGASLSGMDSAITRMSNSAKKIANASSPPPEGTAPTNIAAELVSAKVDSILYEANVKALKVQLETEQRILDILT